MEHTQEFMDRRHKEEQGKEENSHSTFLLCEPRPVYRPRTVRSARVSGHSAVFEAPNWSSFGQARSKPATVSRSTPPGAVSPARQGQSRLESTGPDTPGQGLMVRILSRHPPQLTPYSNFKRCNALIIDVCKCQRTHAVGAVG